MSATDREQRDKLAAFEYMRRRAFTTHDWDELPEQAKDFWRGEVDVLLPVVQAMCEERAADELRAAADELTDRTRSWIPNRLRDRADALDQQ